MRVAWKRLIRFEAKDGRILYGEPILPSEDYDLGLMKRDDNLTAKIIKGHDIFSEAGDTHVSDEIASVQKVLGPLTAAEVPILRCVGLNYAKHSEQLPTLGRMNRRPRVKALANSQRSRKDTSSFPVYLLQAEYYSP